MSELKRFWLKTKDSEHSMLVECNESKLVSAMENKGTVSMDRVSRDGELSTVILKGENIMEASEYDDPKKED